MADAYTYDYPNLIAGDFPRVSDEVTVLSGNNLAAGTVVGLQTSGGKAIASDSAAVDGSENAYGVLVEDVDASGADKVSSVYLCGEFVADTLVFGGSDTFADRKAELRALSIFGKPSVSK